MAQKAIVKLCMCLVLVLMVGVATSAWSQSASGDNKGKGYGSSSSSTGTQCGGIAGTQCPAGQACKFPVNKCNVADLAGKCVKVKSPCPKGGAKVCGCEGRLQGRGDEVAVRSQASPRSSYTASSTERIRCSCRSLLGVPFSPKATASPRSGSAKPVDER